MHDPHRIGSYRVLSRLGSGGMGEVFLALDEELDRRVAIKRIHPDTHLTPLIRSRFRREARLAARLNHPSIAQIMFCTKTMRTASSWNMWKVKHCGSSPPGSGFQC